MKLRLTLKKHRLASLAFIDPNFVSIGVLARERTLGCSISKNLIGERIYCGCKFAFINLYWIVFFTPAKAPAVGYGTPALE